MLLGYLWRSFWTHNPLVQGSNPCGPNSQTSENKEVTENDKASDKTEKSNLVSGLFSAQELLEKWEKLPVEIKEAITKLLK